MNRKSSKGVSKKVDPIMELKDIRAIKKLLKDNPRDYCLFVIGINTNLRASDLVRITVGMVKELKPGEEFEFVEKKTQKHRRVTLNKECIEAVQNLIQSFKMPRSDDSQLFRGREGDIKPISVNYLVRKWTSMLNLKGKYGAHSLRKTFGYHMRVQHKVSIPVLMHIFNHHSQKQTLDYL